MWGNNIEMGYNYCCGVQEVSGLSDSDTTKSLYVIIGNLLSGGYDCGFVMFTEVRGQNDNYGERLAKLIKKENLGNVINTRTKLNRNSGNQIRVYLWEFNYNKIKKYYANFSCN